ncbi:cobalt-precorrin-6A reductase [Litoreibacter roseus]|uniref:Precorrin-6A reductase n=1 Tax=Litoreibacter roseus TaxID=2601869 RepID=A0A6N6JDM4_9RHOB|nr:cobalt-precorrin-6A reductase [Litoreibacter roseus]GFE64265.1 precorrin-6A reductase [Litoreibacter roseus]
MTILVLAGTAEARDLIARLIANGEEVIASLAGATRAPVPLGTATRQGGFGGDAGFSSWLAAHEPQLVIDATHPYAERVTRRSARICRQVGIPFLRIEREGWTPSAEDDWIFIDRPESARNHLPAGSRVFLATGRQTLRQFENLSDCTLFCRQIDPPDRPFPFPNGEYVVGRPPFSIPEEVDLFTKLAIDFLVVKNSGGTASRSKLDAAAQMGLTVLMIERPQTVACETVATVGDAMDWVARHALD